MASCLLPKSPVSLSLWDEVPHIFIPKSHLERREFLISSAKRLLQHNRHKADVPGALIDVRFRHKSRHQDLRLSRQLLSHFEQPQGTAMTSARFPGLLDRKSTRL